MDIKNICSDKISKRLFYKKHSLLIDNRSDLIT